MYGDFLQVVVEKFNPWKDAFISGLFLLLIGILLAVLQGEGLKWILIIAGVLALISGIMAIVESMQSKFSVGLAMGVVTVLEKRRMQR